jgi:hypothetical protein
MLSNGKRQIARWNMGEERGKIDKDKDTHQSEIAGIYHVQLYRTAPFHLILNSAHISLILVFRYILD